MFACDMHVVFKAHCCPPTIFILTGKAKYCRKNYCKLFNSNGQGYRNIKYQAMEFSKILQRIAKYIEKYNNSAY